MTLSLPLSFAACGNQTEQALQSKSASPASIDETLRSVQLSNAGLVSRAQTFTTLAELRRSSELVVVATAGSASPHPTDDGGEFQLSFLDVNFTAEKVLAGTAGSTIDVFAEGPEKFVPGKRYLLFLTPLFPGKPTYAVTGYIAGMYEQVTIPGKRLAFGRVDPESPGLPQGIEVGAEDGASLRKIS